MRGLGESQVACATCQNAGLVGGIVRASRGTHSEVALVACPALLAYARAVDTFTVATALGVSRAPALCAVRCGCPRAVAYALCRGTNACEIVEQSKMGLDSTSVATVTVPAALGFATGVGGVVAAVGVQALRAVALCKLTRLSVEPGQTRRRARHPLNIQQHPATGRGTDLPKQLQ